MNPTNSLLSKRNLIIIIIVVIIIFITTLLITFIGKGKQETSIIPPSGSSALHAFPTMTPYNSFPNGSRYKLSTYSIAYPQGSQNTVSVFIGGSTLIIEPPNYPNEPVFDVEAYTSAQNLAQKEALYIASGATKSTINVNNMVLPELRVTYNMRTINSKPIHTPTQLRLAYLVQPHAFYVFRMYYSSSVSVQADEDLFTQFIKSFSLN